MQVRLSQNTFTGDEINLALQKTKNAKDAGFNGIFPEF